MFLRMLGVAGLIGLLGVARADDKPLAAEMKKFEGTWEFAESLRDGEGKPGEEIKTYRLVVKGDTFENLKDGKVVGRGTWRFVAQKGKVFHIDVTPAEGPDRGRVFTAIFEWAGDDGARFCGPAEIGGDRPTKFTGAKGSKQLLVAYKRAKQ